MISIVSMKLFLISYDSMKWFYEIISDYIRFYEISMKFFLISYDSMKLLIQIISDYIRFYETINDCFYEIFSDFIWFYEIVDSNGPSTT